MYKVYVILQYQYTETNVMHFSFNLLRIKGLYMFRALLAHPLEALHKRHLEYCLRMMSFGCGTVAVYLCTNDIIRTQYTTCRLCRPPEDEQVMLKICTGR
jgi:hypothetical protein